MKYRELGRTDLSVSTIALGTVELGMDYGIQAPDAYGRPSYTEAERLVHAALDAGINLIDTARAYGESEAVLGRALQGRRNQVVLATKATVQLGGKTLSGAALRQAMWDDLEKSLQALQTDYIDLWQIHNVDGNLLAQAETVAEVFARAQASGMVRWCGGSFYGAVLPLAALKTDLFDVLQVTYSVLDQRLAERVFPAAAENGIGIVVRSILLQGALTARADHLPDRVGILRARSRQYRRLVAERMPGLTPAQVAIAFGLAETRIGSVLVGMRSEAELAENLVASSTHLDTDLVDELRRLRLDDEELLNPGTWFTEDERGT